ncbi:MAG: hypothetical protein EOP83_08640 [Verrucomicrobiaceae bacterium]|nr:MAG: hypothetical protein EOP83_08640 [Verrucomicrobiaceae bacterium]
MTDQNDIPTHLLALGQPPKRDIARMVADRIALLESGADTVAPTEFEPPRPIVAKLDEAQGVVPGYEFAVRVDARGDDLQAMYDWGYDQWGMAPERWSFTGGLKMGFNRREDAEAIIAQFNGVTRE